MPFAFFNPWFWLGAVALGIPLWLHLRRKRETNLLRFSTLRFLEDQPQPRRGPLRLRDRVLFVLRALVLLLILAAFAWPYVRSGQIAPVRESRVYVLDNTLSRQADGSFARDRDRIAEDLASAGSGLQVAVVELRSTPRTLVSFGEDREIGIAKVKALQPSFQRGSYLAAFRQANSVLSRAVSNQKQIIFLGDHQENQWTENTASPPFLRDTRVEYSEPPMRQKPNVSLADPRVQRTFLGDKTRVNLTVKLMHQGGARSANVVIRANGQVIYNQAAVLEKSPDTVQLQTQWESDASIWVRGEVAVEGRPDALAGDNRVFFTLPPVSEGRVALLAQSPYLRLALSKEVMRGHWAARVLEPARLGVELAGKQEADVLCLECSYLQSREARGLVMRYLSEGRGVLLLIDQVTPAVRGFLSELGFEAEGTVTSPVGAEETFQFVLHSHPMLHPFSSPDYGSLMDIRVGRYTRLKARQATPLIFSERGAPLLFQSARAQGRLYVAAFGLDRESTSWPVHATFVPFLDLAFQAIRADDSTLASYEPGQTAVVALSRGSGAKEAILSDSDREVARAPIQNGRVRLIMPDQPGIYTMTRDGHSEIERLFSVNPSPKESQLAYAESPAALKTWQVEKLSGKDRTAENPVLTAQAQIGSSTILRQKIWWWILIVGLLAIFTEMILAEARKETA